MGMVSEDESSEDEVETYQQQDGKGNSNKGIDSGGEPIGLNVADVKMEGVIKKLQCLRSEFNQETQTELDKLVMLQEHFETKVCNTESIHLSQAERLRKQNNYVIKIKSCIKIYHNLIEKLSKHIKIAKGELERSEKKIRTITSVSDDEVKMLEMKIERYEKELLKFEKRYPWLSDPQYNLQNISKETETLNNLRKAKEKLIQDLDVYHGLKPDVCEAAQQLENLKKEYDAMKFEKIVLSSTNHAVIMIELNFVTFSKGSPITVPFFRCVNGVGCYRKVVVDALKEIVMSINWAWDVLEILPKSVEALVNFGSEER
ncbi:hypothetical protein FQA39_LY06618 [Lamprigera yunnana]|nr:hypothetical protein FQA39_LY06618 [Lamprigera yunnana]